MYHVVPRSRVPSLVSISSNCALAQHGVLEVGCIHLIVGTPFVHGFWLFNHVEGQAMGRSHTVMAPQRIGCIHIPMAPTPL